MELVDGEVVVDGVEMGEQVDERPSLACGDADYISGTDVWTPELTAFGMSFRANDPFRWVTGLPSEYFWSVPLENDKVVRLESLPEADVLRGFDFRSPADCEVVPAHYLIDELERAARMVAILDEMFLIGQGVAVVSGPSGVVLVLSRERRRDD